MLIEKMKDQWICSCGNWVAQGFSWCPDCCEDIWPAHNAGKPDDPFDDSMQLVVNA